jgi:hypothetical protein
MLLKPNVHVTGQLDLLLIKTPQLRQWVHPVLMLGPSRSGTLSMQFGLTHFLKTILITYLNQYKFFGYPSL